MSKDEIERDQLPWKQENLISTSIFGFGFIILNFSQHLVSKNVQSFNCRTPRGEFFFYKLIKTF